MTKRVLEVPHTPSLTWLNWPAAGLALLLLAIGLAWVSSRSGSFAAWWPLLGPMLTAMVLAAALLWIAWRLVQVEAPPRWLAHLLLGAALLRLAAGAFWYVAAPIGGYNSQAELQGYIMADAYERDQAAWRLAQSDQPLLDAFRGNQGYRKADQYGGLLFLSAAYYRFLGGAVHQPLLLVVLAAASSGLAILFTWAFVRRAWNATAAGLAAGALAFYPEAVLLGSSQMREAFTVTLAVLAFYSLIRYRQDHAWPALALAAGAVLLSLPFSPPSAALLVFMLFLTAPGMGGSGLRKHLPHRRREWLMLGGVGLVVLVGLWLALLQFSPEGGANPLALIAYWARKSAQLQAFLSKNASGWIQKYFAIIPEWSRTPLLVAYGVVQPFLPAAIGDVTGAKLWRAIAIWRAVGWTALLPFLIYAPLRAFSRHGSSLTRGLSVAIWVAILVAAYRGGADLWDNPRYRMVFAGLQVALAAWAIVEQRRSPDPWLRRALVGVLAILAWFVPWYLRRYIYFPWPVVDLFRTLGLGFATAALYIIWDWARSAGPLRPAGSARRRDP